MTYFELGLRLASVGLALVGLTGLVGVRHKVLAQGLRREQLQRLLFMVRCRAFATKKWVLAIGPNFRVFQASRG